MFIFSIISSIAPPVSVSVPVSIPTPIPSCLFIGGKDALGQLLLLLSLSVLSSDRPYGLEEGREGEGEIEGERERVGV